MKMTEEDLISYNDGYNSYNLGLDKVENPYKDEDLKFHWENGWIDAFEDVNGR